MALARKKATTIALLSIAAEQRGISRAEFVRQHLTLVLEQFRRRPRPRIVGLVRRPLAERGDETELYSTRRR